jgi:Putative amidase domain
LGDAAKSYADSGRPADQLAIDDEQTIRSLIHRYYQHRADSITEKSRSLNVQDWRNWGTPEFVERLDADFESLFRARDLAARSHGGYADATTETDAAIVASTPLSRTLRVSETTTLRFAGKHPADFPASRYRINHEVRVVKARSNRWLIAEARFMPSGALPPLTQPASPVFTSSVNSANAESHPFNKVSTVERDADAVRAARLRFNGVSPKARYRYDLMAGYSIYWATKRNSNYPDFHTAGGDCTNFVSQCLESGGWERVGPPGKNNRAKWFAGRTIDACSFTWGGANPFHSFAALYSGRMHVIDTVWGMSPADVLQFDFGGDGTIDHTQIVTSYHYDEQSLEFYMTQHDDDYLMRPLSEILNSVLSTNPHCKFYAHQHTT